MKSASSSVPATSVPKTGGGKGANILSPGHSSVTGNKGMGSRISLKGDRKTGSKR